MPAIASSTWHKSIRYVLKHQWSATTDLLPIIVVIVFFQVAVIRQPLPNLGEILFGTVLVVIGLSMFIEGLETTLFPLGESMAHSLTRKGSLFWPLHYLIIGGYIAVMVLTISAPQEIIGIACDAGGVTTSTITVPLVTALGVGLATIIRGRNPLTDGFGMIALASLLPMVFVMGYGLFVF